MSVLCTAYNHEQYILTTLEGFVMQETDFKYEVIIHDDASSDQTPLIIQEYVKKFPNIFVPIIQTENQYSKGVSIYEEILYPMIRGEYYAICEGDDFWTDPHKLQKQFDAMEQNSKIDCCAHAANLIDSKTGKIIGMVNPRSADSVIVADDVINGGGGFVATSSLFFRSRLVRDEFAFLNIMTLDYAWQIHGSLRGGMLYLNDCMSSYRINTIGSWSERVGNDMKKHNAHTQKVINMLEQLNFDTNFKYNEAVSEMISRCKMLILERSGEFIKAFTKEYFHDFCHLPIRKKIKFIYKSIF